jgi:hypothetical protein
MSKSRKVIKFPKSKKPEPQPTQHQKLVPLGRKSIEGRPISMNDKVDWLIEEAFEARAHHERIYAALLEKLLELREMLGRQRR